MVSSILYCAFNIVFPSVRTWIQWWFHLIRTKRIWMKLLRDWEKIVRSASGSEKCPSLNIRVFKGGLALRTFLSGDRSTSHGINYFNRPLDVNDGYGNHWLTPSWSQMIYSPSLSGSYLIYNVGEGIFMTCSHEKKKHTDTHKGGFL